MTTDKSNEQLLLNLLGSTQARILRRFVRRTGLSPKFLLKLGLDLVAVHIATAMPKHPEAVRLGAKRWAGMTAEARSQIARLAVNARWDRVRARKAEAELADGSTKRG